MNRSHLFHITSFVFIFLFCVHPSHCDHHGDQLSACRGDYAYKCGSGSLNISYPFWGGDRHQYCGHKGFEIKCDESEQYPFIEMATRNFKVLNISYADTKMTLVHAVTWNDHCAEIILHDNTFFDSVQFKYTTRDENLSFFYDCDEEISHQSFNYFNCSVDNEVMNGFYTIQTREHQFHNRSSSCKKGIKIPVLASAGDDLVLGRLEEALMKGFEVEYNADNMHCAGCLATGGICAASNRSNAEQFVCLCPDEFLHQTCPPQPSPGVTTAICALALVAIFRILIGKKKGMMFRKKTGTSKEIENYIRNYGSLAPKRYKFSDIKKMTNSFENKIGQGGYGGIYKGKLKDGTLIAVKLLNTSKGNGQEFINEVASISRTSHVNVVTLLGFCLEGSKRALIYQFLPNGSLEKFIYSKSSGHLGWENLYQIALGIARGLEYLHRGCTTRIFHFDIKPHNILLDEDLCPKIADFGLAKLCPKNESNVSMMEARGTNGYIAPEIFSRNFGEVSHKSDVYSYGMMVLEMVGGRKNLHLEVKNSSEIYFPKWIYKQLEVHGEIRWHDTMISADNEIAKKMVMVGLWCIQTTPHNRPSINKVIEMLQGDIQALEIPPNPFPSSPQRLVDSTTISIS